jgi:hypothetical protein
MRFAKKLSPDAEAMNILVAQLEFLTKQISAFIRLYKPILLDDLPEVNIWEGAGKGNDLPMQNINADSHPDSFHIRCVWSHRSYRSVSRHWPSHGYPRFRSSEFFKIFALIIFRHRFSTTCPIVYNRNGSY